MSPKAIISYDDTLNDQDALILGRLLAAAGASLVLTYVRHTRENERVREDLQEHEAEALLDRGARWLGDLDVERRVVLSGSTADGLRWLAEQEGADLVVFGSDYRTAAGHVSPQHSCQTLLENGSTAVAIAPASYRAPQPDSVRRIGLLAGPGEQAAVLTARELAGRLDAELVAAEPGERVDLLVVASRPEAPAGRLMISSQAQNAIENATAPVLVLCRGVPLRFGQTVSA
jgi:nucleotide-binding universal stress UspA family protein